MSDWKTYFKGKKITVMGLGLLGRGLGDVRFLAKHGVELIVTDLKTKEALAPSLAQLAEYKNITYVLGEHRLEDFRDRDMVLKAAGVPLDSQFIQEAERHNIPIKMSTSLFAKLSGIPVVGVTGTRGKTTTTEMIAAIMKQDGREVILGGNIQGMSTLEQLELVTKNSIAVLELDSWSLQGFGEEKISPEIAVFTTFYPDHLNYYNGDLDRYLADKANIFLNQTPEDTLVVGEQVSELLQKKYGKKIQSKVVIAKPSQLTKSWTLAIPGEHNRYNAACALAAARALGVDDEVSKEALAHFAGVAGRLEFLREIDGVKIYNDTTSTTPEATLAALSALKEEGKKNIALIMGGADKGLNMSALLQEVQESCKKIILLQGSGTDKMKMAFPDSPIFDSLQPAVTEAKAAARAGDVILFSPAFASFGMFKNEYDRGDQFVALIKNLK